MESLENEGKKGCDGGKVKIWKRKMIERNEG